MIGEIILYILFGLVFLIVSADWIIQYLFLFQLGSYSQKNLFLSLLSNKTQLIFCVLIYLLILSCYLLADIKEIIVLILLIFLIGVVLVVLGNHFQNARKIVYTKRMLRLLVICLVINLLCGYFIVRFVSQNLLVIFLPMTILWSLFVVLLSNVILMPFELLIGKYYISKAKNILRLHKKLICIGIAGSFGKTSVKEILVSMLSEHFSVLSTPKSFNTPFGVTKTIISDLKDSHEIFVCEMGAKRRGDIKYLCELVGVGAGILTSLGRQHMATFGSFENIYKAKSELPNALFNKVCVFNLSNAFTKAMYDEFVGKRVGVFLCEHREVLSCRTLKNMTVKYNKCKHQKFALFKENVKYGNYYAKNIKCTEFGSVFDIYYSGKYLNTITTYLIGKHNIINILLAFAMAFDLGESVDNITMGLSKVHSINARLEKINHKNGAIVLNNGYNSNIDSSKFTLETLLLFERANKVVITPGLVETENDYDVNIRFGKLVARYATNVVIVKEYNRLAIWKGLMDSGFDMCNVKCVDRFEEAKKIIDRANENYVFLIENDLPENYR